jgi:hypothetical protein
MEKLLGYFEYLMADLRKIYLNIVKDMKKKLSTDLNDLKQYFTSLNGNDSRLNLNDLESISMNDSMFSD